MSPLEKRLYENRGPKRILTLDGGGIRGALTLGFLAEIEQLIRDQHDDQSLLLCDYFDLIVGTSTGGIIAAGLATGMDTSEIKKMYLELGSKIFGAKLAPWLPGKKSLRLLFLPANYSEVPLEEALLERFGDLRIDDQDKIKTGLAIVTKRADTFSTWPVHNFIRGKYYEENKHILIRDLLRATSAAPTYFRAKEMVIDTKGNTGAFIDGGVSLANNPGFQAMMLATLKGFSLNWPFGKDRLMITSVGTGTSTKKLSRKEVINAKSVSWAARIPELFMEDATYFSQALLQWLSKAPSARKIDSEIGDLKTDTLIGAKPLFYNRYNVRLDHDELLEFTGRDFTPEEVNSLREMDHAHNVKTLAEIGEAAAQQRISPDDFPEHFKIGAPNAEMVHLKRKEVPSLDFELAVKKPIPIRVKQMDTDFLVETEEGPLMGRKGDYLAVGVRGEMYPIQCDIFEETYDVQKK